MAKSHPNPERAFGLSVGTVLLLIAAFAWWRERLLVAEVLAAIGFVLVTLGHFKPGWLYYPSKAWWRAALALGHVNARVILTVVFAVVLTPIGVIWRVIGRDPLSRSRKSWPGWTTYPARYRDRDHFTRMY